MLLVFAIPCNLAIFRLFPRYADLRLMNDSDKGKKEKRVIHYTLFMEKYSKIKDELLKSGLPLESMVADSVSSLSAKLPSPLINMDEYFFERSESELALSVDFQVMHDLDIENCDFVEIAFLIECKYRTQGTGWYFIDSPLRDAGMEFFVENFFSKGKCNRKNFPVLIPPLNISDTPIVGKGTEIYSNGKGNEKSITEGIHQLMFACCSSLSRAFISEEEMRKTMMDRKIDITNRSWHSLLCPVLVTTADLYYLKKPAIEKIEHSEKVGDICSCEGLIAYSTPKPPLYVSRYIREHVFQDVKPMLISETDKKRAMIYLSNYSLFYPSRYYILNYRYIERFLKEYIDFASSMLAYASKKGSGQ